MLVTFMFVMTLPDSIGHWPLRALGIASRMVTETAVSVPSAALLAVIARNVPVLISASVAGRRRITRVLSVKVTIVLPIFVATVADVAVADAIVPSIVVAD